MKSFACLLLATALPLAAAAQTVPPDSAAIYKHQLGLTASPVLDGFFRNNRALPVGLLYKRQTKPNQALRARLVGQYSRRDSTDFLGTLPGSVTYEWSAMLFGGYEWQQSLGRHTSWYYGAELGSGWGQAKSRDVREVPNQFGPGKYAYESRYVINRWQVQARPFVGLMLHASARVRVFAEAALVARYERRRYNLTNTVLRQNTDGTLVNGYAFYTGNTFQMQLRPVQLVGVSYLF
ncbi:hypothetical protein CDA63_08460 [Hymenobacter amundsenii]|uniref:DUF3575 domain-containing protein n=1 Tax=Hymenobacter amundsenii TaxID=2006685 RepID=A0A246FLI2_9BACT|nr:hypothetical protein [Hymenobacter amundsenii]OWP63601.1 hypothetical protein CDA63_08460 [Hymenobacter amundsenii]